jgi:hypothetical protein
VSGIYLTWLAAELRAGGCSVVEYDGWESRARSSGGFASGRPLAVFWHHTASVTSPGNDSHYMCHQSDNRPVANILVARDGVVWVLAAGCTNTNGKGRSMEFSRGTVAADSANSYVFGMEIANSGTGELYPAAQIDAAFKVSNIVNRKMGNLASDVCTHQCYAPDRKIDPAMGGYTVQGTWHPNECTSAGSWDVGDLEQECARRWGGDGEDDDVTDQDIERIAARTAELVWEWTTTNYRSEPPIRDTCANMLSWTHAEAFDAAHKDE